MITPDMLARSPLFAHVPAEILQEFAELAEEVTCARDGVLFEEGDPARTLYLLLRGKALVKVEIASRAEQVCIAVLTHPGQVIGWSALLPDNHYTATVTCSEDTRLAAFDREALMRALEADPVTGFVVMKHISEVISGRLRNIQRLVLKTL
jgi:CRP-like cAMP-binding protein